MCIGELEDLLFELKNEVPHKGNIDKIGEYIASIRSVLEDIEEIIMERETKDSSLINDVA